MIIVTITKTTSYFFDGCDIETMANDTGFSFEDCKAMLLSGEFEIPEIEANCGFDCGEINDYKAVEE